MANALIIPEMLKWAREKCLLSIDELAQKMHISSDKYQSWEEGTLKPTFNQAQNLAKKLHIPFGYLFLKNPPKIDLPIPDFRTVINENGSSISNDLKDTIFAIQRKQEWFHDYQIENGFSNLDICGKMSIKNTPKEVAQDIINTLDIDHQTRLEASNWEEFLRMLINKIEDIGILVMRNGIVENNTHRQLDVGEFRGFAICDNIAPLIFLNGKDAKVAQIFTLAHELAHLWIGESGISNIDIGNITQKVERENERFCDQVAAEVLSPESEFHALWLTSSNPSDNIDKLTRYFRVSRLVIIRRAYDLRKISRSTYNLLYEAELKDIEARLKRQRQSTGGNYYATMWTRHSSLFTSTLISSVFEGQTLHRDAARLLSMKVKNINKLATEMGVY